MYLKSGWVWFTAGIVLVAGIVLSLMMKKKALKPTAAKLEMKEEARIRVAEVREEAALEIGRAQGIEEAVLVEVEEIREIKDQKERLQRLANLINRVQ